MQKIFTVFVTLIRFLPGFCIMALLAAGNFPGRAIAQMQSEIMAEPNAAALLAKHAALAGPLAHNAYGRPLFLESSETATMVSGNAYAVLDSPFSQVSEVFSSPVRWCDVMMLHINTKYCRAASDATPSVLRVNIGKKTAQELADSFALEFAFRLNSALPNYLAVQLNANKGPLGTSDYRIELRAVPLPQGKTFMHLRYAYGYGLAGRLAMQAYLGTLGSGKVGFTAISQGQTPIYVTGMRGAVERNTMRYYLAIEAYLPSLDTPTSQQLDGRLARWFDATEQYPRQLHEVDKSSYLRMKKSEYARQQAGPGAAGP